MIAPPPVHVALAALFVACLNWILLSCGPAEQTKDPKKIPAFLLVAPRITAAPEAVPRVIESLELGISSCQTSGNRVEKVTIRDGDPVYVNFVLADADCAFEILALSLRYDEPSAPAVVFRPESSTGLGSGQQAITTRLSNTDRTLSLIGQFSTTYKGNFNENATMVLLFGYENITRGLGLEQRRVDNTPADGTAPSPDYGVGLRIDSMILKKSPDNKGIIAIEARLGCFEIRDGTNCMGRSLMSHEFILLPEQANPPTEAELTAAFADPLLITQITTENLFGNGVYAVVSTPSRLPITNVPATRLWLYVRNGDRISALEISTENLRVF